MSDNQAITDLICQKVRDVIRLKTDKSFDLHRDTVLLGGEILLDSLDLAGIVVELESITGKDPFSNGFVDFRTIGQLAELYAKP
jgi:acyl carrier protein